MATVWQNLLDEYDIKFIVLDVADDTEIIRLLRAQPGWIVEYEDTEAIFFSRVDSAPVEKYGTTGLKSHM
jgi:hypothetical protein